WLWSDVYIFNWVLQDWGTYNCLLLMGRRTVGGCGRQRRDGLRGYVFGERGQRRFQSDLQDLVHGIHEMKLHGVAQVFRDFGDVFLVVLGQNHFEESGAM